MKFRTWFLITLGLWSGQASAIVENGYLISPCLRESLLLTLGNLDYEIHEPRPRESWAARHRELYSAMLKLFIAKPGWEVAFPHGVPKGLSLEFLVEQVMALRREIADDLRKLIRMHSPLDRPLERLLDSSARQFDLTFADPRHSTWSERIHLDDLELLKKRSKGVRLVSFDRRIDVINLLMHFLQGVRSAWGELRAAFLFPDLIAHDHMVQALHRVTPLFPVIRTGDQSGWGLTNIDLLGQTEKLLRFGEVKTFFQPLEYDEVAGSHWDNLNLQLIRLHRIADYVHTPTEVHAVLINGMSRRAHRELVAQGFIPHGPIFGP